MKGGLIEAEGLPGVARETRWIPPLEEYLGAPVTPKESTYTIDKSKDPIPLPLERSIPIGSVVEGTVKSNTKYGCVAEMSSLLYTSTKYSVLDGLERRGFPSEETKAADSSSASALEECQARLAQGAKVNGECLLRDYSGISESSIKVGTTIIGKAHTRWISEESNRIDYFSFSDWEER